MLLVITEKSLVNIEEWMIKKSKRLTREKRAFMATK